MRSTRRWALALVAAAAVALVAAAGAPGEPAGEGPVHAEGDSGEPLDPAGPWVVDAATVEVGVGDQARLSLTTPLTARADEGPVDEVAVLGPEGRVLAAADCSTGACTLATPLGTREVPAATVELDGPWHEGRAGGFTLAAADGEAVVEARVFDGQGVRLTGRGLADPVAVTAPLVLEGDPRDVERVALLDPGGDPALVVEPSAEGPGAVEVGDRRVHADQVHATLHGDPLSDGEVLLRVWVEERRWGVIVKQTPAAAYQAAGEALSEHLVLRSPAGEGEASLALSAGPARVEDAGRLSPAYDADARVAVRNASGFDRGWLTVDGEPRADLTAAGREGGARVLLGVLPGEDLPGGWSEVGARLERTLAPGLVQVREVDPVNVRADEEGPDPPAPEPAPRADGFAWEDRDGVARWEAQARPAGGDWRDVPTNGTSARVPDGGAGRWEGRVRGVDDVGNEGPWSDPTSWDRGAGEEQTPPAPELSLEAPAPGAEVSGTVAVRWAPDPGIATVRVDAFDRGGWRTLAQGGQPPLVWDTRRLPDGDQRIRVAASGPGGRTSQVLEVTVDNLDPLEPRAAGPIGEEAGRDAEPPPARPMPGEPLSRAVVAGLAVVGLGLGVARVSGDGKW